MDVDNIDLDLKLLAGVPIDVGIGKIYPLKLSEIRDIGEQKYNSYLSVINIDPKQLEIEDETVKPFHIITTFCSLDQVYREKILKAMSLFFKEEVKFHSSGIFFIGEDRIVDESNFELIKDVIKKQNFISEKKDDFENYKVSDDEKTKQILEMRKKIKAKIQKENKENGLNLSDVISIVASYVPNVNLFNVWDLTVYQLYTLYSRLMMKENYESNFAVYLQSGDPSKLDLTHWARKINNK